jgi:benzoyl-CoA reductase subunit C
MTVDVCGSSLALDAALKEIIDKCRSYYHDVGYQKVAEWKRQDQRRKAVAFLPVYCPREIILGCGIRPVASFGGGDQINVIRGDSYYQSYICHLPRSVVELGFTSWRDSLDGLICPATCDVIRNVSGVWQVLFPDKLTYYLDVPQNFDEQVGGKFFKTQLADLSERLCALAGTTYDAARVQDAIKRYNRNRCAIRELSQLRVEEPGWVPAWEFYLVTRAGDQMEVDEHTQLVERYLEVATSLKRPEQDNARIVIVGGFCEQPPLNLIRAIELSGCYIVYDDFTLGMRFIEKDVDEHIEPLAALSAAYLTGSTWSSVKYEGETPKSRRLVELVRRTKADGVLLMSPSFCDPSLLDRPHFQLALDEAQIPYSTLMYAENLGQFAPIREQTGTFAEAIKLWG